MHHYIRLRNFPFSWSPGWVPIHYADKGDLELLHLPSDGIMDYRGMAPCPSEKSFFWILSTFGYKDIVPILGGKNLLYLSEEKKTCIS